MIKVLIADDSKFVREVLTEIINSDKDLYVIGEAENGEEAFQKAKELHPDIITLDIEMPEYSGFYATEKIMAFCPTPIIIISSTVNQEEAQTSMRAISLGALDAMEKPDISTAEKFKSISDELNRKLKTLSKIKVITHLSGKFDLDSKKLKKLPEHPGIIVIGTSTGGPMALLKLFEHFDTSFPIPLVLVQHIEPGFTEGFVAFLNRDLKLDVKIAEDGERPQKGYLYVAPEKFHIGFKRGVFKLKRKAPKYNNFIPSINNMFVSAAKEYGRDAIGILLTGMGSDGAEGLKQMKDQGALTIVQDKESSQIFGMPREAIKLEAHSFIMPPNQISSLLIKQYMEKKEI